MPALVLPVGEERYAIDTARVREVIADPRATPLPGAPGWVLGVINLRGEVVPLLDTTALLGLGAMGPASFAVVVDLELGPAALGTTGSPEVATLDEPLGPSELPGTLGRHRVDRDLVVLLEPDALLAAARGDAPLPAGGAG
ncbi:MAG: chemotaxis protein CheW [Ilumatobacteraceae bacterium]